MKNKLTIDILNSVTSNIKREGFIAGYCSAAPFYELNTEKMRSAPFTRVHTIERRLDPSLTLPGCKSIIVCGLSYNKSIPALPDNKRRGVFSANACGADYHTELRGLLTDIADNLKEHFPGTEYTIQADTGPLPETEVFIRAGLGFRGKHNLVINEKIGSMLNIGLLLTTIDISQTAPVQTTACGSCDVCVTACPTGAIDGSGFDYNKCISYLSQKKGELSPEEQEALGFSLYGCDICQRACPYNTDKAIGALSPDEVYPLLSDILSMTDAEFKTRFEHRSCYWRGADILKRNARYINERYERTF